MHFVSPFADLDLSVDRLFDWNNLSIDLEAWGPWDVGAKVWSSKPSRLAGHKHGFVRPGLRA